MSNEAREAVKAHSGQRANAYLVMLCIAEFANPNGYAFPAVDTLAEWAHMAPRSVQRYLAELEDAGELRIERGVGRGNISHYWLLVGDLHTKAHERSACHCTYQVNDTAGKGDRKGDKPATDATGKGDRIG